MKRLLIAWLFGLLLPMAALAQQPSPAAKSTDPALSPEAHARIEKLALERRVISLQMDLLERDYRARQQEVEAKSKELEAAITDEAVKAKVDPKTVRPDLTTKTWRKAQP